MPAKRVFAPLVLLLAVLYLLGCDRIGNLSERETEAFYTEIKTDLTAGQLWDMNPAFFHEDKELDDDIDFLKAGVETVFTHEDLITGRYGAFYSDRSYCKVCRMTGQVPFRYGETEYVIDEYQVAKYYHSGGYKMWLYYHKSIDAKAKDYIEVVLQGGRIYQRLKQNDD